MYAKNTSEPAYSKSWTDLNNLKGIVLFPFDILRPASSIATIYKMQNNK